MHKSKKLLHAKALYDRRRNYRKNPSIYIERSKQYYCKNKARILEKRANDYQQIKLNKTKLRKYRQMQAEKARKYRSKYAERYREQERKRRAQLKLLVLGHYSPGGIPHCSWPGCIMSDVDCLTLDHINNDGAEFRRRVGFLGGVTLYKWLRARGFPDGYQTLCGGHQFKKEILRKRG